MQVIYNSLLNKFFKKNIHKVNYLKNCLIILRYNSNIIAKKSKQIKYKI